jgi:hypothetical protein
MSGFTKFLVICALIVLGVYVNYLLFFPTLYVRYRLTLDVDVDGVTRTGAGVVEISYQIMPDSWVHGFGGSHFGGDMRGYAVTVDLGERGLLFVVDSMPLLPDPRTGGPLRRRAAYLGSLPLIAYGFPDGDLPSAMRIAVRELKRKTGRVDVPIAKLPMLVRFRDVDDRNSIEELDPRDLAAAYGPGVKLVRATVELTNDPVSPIPPSWPKWLVDEKNQGFVMPSFLGGTTPSIQIWTTDFKGN